ncbi:MAG: glycosyltransferase family 4 protein [Deltaproteobacteria bacterium]|nr:glycosyltransferase family 4 protein [Deltaproteobacteria bacterium]
MKVAIDVRTVLPNRSGVGNYVLHLIQNLRKVDPDSIYFFLSLKKNMSFLGPLAPEQNPLVTVFSHENHPLGDFWEHFILPIRLMKKGIDVFHGPASLIPFRRDHYQVVVTIHDLVAFLFPETIPLKYGAYMRYLLRQAVKRANKIISVSHHTRQDLIEILKVPSEKIVVIHEAPSPIFRPYDRNKVRTLLKERYGIKKKYIYHLGNIEPRKNLIVLLQAFTRVCQELGTEYQLVVSGQKGWLIRSLSHFLKNYPMRDQVLFTGYVPMEDLPFLMNGAEIFVFPSLYEGFGLPVLEAMSCGTPVISSNRSSIPEIVGSAGVLIDPTDVQELAHRIIYLLRNGEERRWLSLLGKDQAARFSWEEVARKTLNVYRSVKYENPF